MYLLQAVLLTALGIWLSVSGLFFGWIIGQSILALAFLQWFILLHEAGHRTLFRSRALNTIAGHISAFCAGFPYSSWVLIHFRHHKWTGWQDLDATTASLVPRPLKNWERQVINFCWKYWIPLFSLIYRINNYWNYPRVIRFVTQKEKRHKVARDILLLAFSYALLISILGIKTFLLVFGLAMLISLVMQEVILLSQHTHVPTNLSHGKQVKPFPPLEQEVYTRSLSFPRWVSRFLLLHFDAHELHHMYVNVPGYDLGKIPYRTRNEVNWWQWIRASKRLSGVSFLFEDRNKTGFQL